MQIRVLLVELAEYTNFFARQPTIADSGTNDPAVADKLRRLASTLQGLLDSTEQVGHS